MLHVLLWWFHSDTHIMASWLLDLFPQLPFFFFIGCPGLNQIHCFLHQRYYCIYDNWSPFTVLSQSEPLSTQLPKSVTAECFWAVPSLLPYLIGPWVLPILISNICLHFLPFLFSNPQLHVLFKAHVNCYNIYFDRCCSYQHSLLLMVGKLPTIKTTISSIGYVSCIHDHVVVQGQWQVSGTFFTHNTLLLHLSLALQSPSLSCLEWKRNAKWSSPSATTR